MSAVVNIYKKKTLEPDVDPYAVRLELEEQYTGPMPISQRWEKKWSPYSQAIAALSAIKGAPRGGIIAKVEQAISEIKKPLQNMALAVAHAKQAVDLCMRMPGMTRERCEEIVSTATGISKSLLHIGGGQQQQGQQQQQQQQGQQQQRRTGA
jgi:hypothetical protein